MSAVTSSACLASLATTNSECSSPLCARRPFHVAEVVEVAETPVDPPVVPVVVGIPRYLSTSAVICAVGASIHVYVCRDRWDGLSVVLKPRSLVVLGVRKQRWPSDDSRTAARLRLAGHEVVVLAKDDLAITTRDGVTEYVAIPATLQD